MGDKSSVQSGVTLPRPGAKAAPGADAPTGLARYEPLATLAEGGSRER